MIYYIILISVIIILQLVIILKLYNKNNDTVIEKLGKFELDIFKSNVELQTKMENQAQNNYNEIYKTLNEQFNNINNSVNARISENFKKTNDTFTSIVERLSKIDEAQKNIETLSTDIVSLQSILSDKSARGSFGEVQLKNILFSIFGDAKKVYQLQYTFSTGSRVDAILFAPAPLNKIGIDSKFPLENYRRAIDNDKNSDSKNYLNAFKTDLKKHIDDIANKYIIVGETEQAIMFLPAEAVFAYMQSYCLDIVEYANKKNVWITSPTTLIATLTTMQVLLENIERDKYTKVIQDELKKLSIEFDRYSDRFDKLNRSIKTVTKDIDDISITSNKITKKFSTITNVELKGED
ncbi:MAG: DNA recombination protein RmuC [Bacilli bacterium]